MLFEEHKKVKEAYSALHGPKARRQKAAERAALRVKRSPLEQWDLLGKRLGTAKGAKKERARLAKRIERGS